MPVHGPANTAVASSATASQPLRRAPAHASAVYAANGAVGGHHGSQFASTSCGTSTPGASHSTAATPSDRPAATHAVATGARRRHHSSSEDPTSTAVVNPYQGRSTGVAPPVRLTLIATAPRIGPRSNTAVRSH